MTPDEDIFAAACALPPAERGALLTQLCVGADQRARIEVLLSAHETESGFLREPGLDRQLEVPGQMIGRYKLLQQLGEGGCGVVWMAEQEDPVRRRVALKVIKLGMDTKEVVARFEAERQALALMDHPNIARVFDGGATSTGRPYFVMELVRGLPITRYCDERNLPTVERLELFIQVCQAVQHAHQKGIIHRDLKPSNVLVTVNDGVAVPKVIDFGIAKATQGRLTDHTLFTAFEQFIGTPAYMSPEQAELTSVDVDTRSDIYTLGVLLYELLTGQTPFDARSLVQSGLSEIRRVICEVEPPRPSARLSTLADADRTTVAKLRSTAPLQLSTVLRGDLDWIVMRCLEKDRSRRYETANGLAVDIRRFLENEPVTACPPSKAYVLRKLVRRHRLAFGAGVAVALALMAGLGFSTWRYAREKAERERASAAERKAIVEAAKSEQVARFLKDMLESVGPSVALGRDTALLREILDQTLQRLGKDLSHQPEVEAELRATIAGVYIELGDYDKAETQSRAALNLRRSAHGNEDPRVASSLRDLGTALLMKGNITEAEPMIREALALRRKLLGNKHRDTADSLMCFGTLLIMKDRSAEAASSIREALAILRTLPVTDDQQSALCSSLNLLSVIALERDDRVEAEALAREMIAIQRKLASGGDPMLLPTQLTILAYLLELRGEPVEAEAAIREALERQRRLLGNQHPEVAHTLANLSSGLVARGRWSEAEAAIREALTISRQSSAGDEGPDAIWHTYKLASVLQAKGELDAAEPLFRDALARSRQQHAADDGALVKFLNGLGDLLCQREKYAEAEPLLRQALSLQRPQAPRTPDSLVELVRTLSNLGSISFHRGDLTEAGTLLNEAHSAQAGLPEYYLAPKTFASLLWAETQKARGELPGAEQTLLATEKATRSAKYYLPPDLQRKIIVDLLAVYESWAQTDPTKAALATEWREKLANFEPAPPR